MIEIAAPIAFSSKFLSFCYNIHEESPFFVLFVHGNYNIPLKGGFPLLLFLEKFPYRVKFYTKAMGLTGHTFGVGGSERFLDEWRLQPKVLRF